MKLYGVRIYVVDNNIQPQISVVFAFPANRRKEKGRGMNCGVKDAVAIKLPVSEKIQVMPPEHCGEVSTFNHCPCLI